MISADAGIYIWLAALLLFLPFDWVVSALTAAVVHEIFHAAALLALGGKIRSVRISVSGCVIESQSPGNWQSGCSILAGPVGSISLLLLRRVFPQIAVCGLFHGLYNLLPLMPLDGGRLLSLVLDGICPKSKERILIFTGRIVCVLFFAVLLWAALTMDIGTIPVCFCLFWLMKMLPRKIPCKPFQIKVQ